MNRKELFFTLLEKELKGCGYSYIKSKNRFKKKFKDKEYLIRFTSWPLFFQVGVDYSILLKEVEKVKKIALGNDYRKFETCGINKMYLDKSEANGILFTHSEEYINLSVKKEVLFINTIVEEYFSKHSSYQFINDEYNTELKENIPDVAHFNRFHSFAVAIFSAKVESNPCLQQLIQHYRSIIKKKQSEFLNETDLFIQTPDIIT